MSSAPSVDGVIGYPKKWRQPASTAPSADACMPFTKRGADGGSGTRTSGTSAAGGGRTATTPPDGSSSACGSGQAATHRAQAVHSARSRLTGTRPLAGWIAVPGVMQPCRQASTQRPHPLQQAGSSAGIGFETWATALSFAAGRGLRGSRRK